ncbi:MAG TPA: YIP1 family protein [Leptolyngbya sp.]|nr:YIP1 family protein [Leptolyngbya sp.]
MVKQPGSQNLGIWQTIWNALTLSSQLYETAQHDRRNRRIALTIVLLAAISRAIGNVVISLLNRVTLPALLSASLLGIFSDVVGYYFWSFTVWKIGQWAKFNPPSYQMLLSPIGFAYSPQVLNFLTLIPLLGRPIELILGAWTLLAVAVAVREAMSISTLQATIMSLASFPLIQIVVSVIQVVGQQFRN